MASIALATAKVRLELSSGTYGRSFVAYTDGSHRSSGEFGVGSGGWAASLFAPRGERWDVWGRTGETSSNRVETCAFLAVLLCVPEGSRVNVHTDSRNLVDRVKLHKFYGTDEELWLEIAELLCVKHLDVSATWVPGHSGWSPNDRVDQLAGLHGATTPHRQEPRRGSRPYRSPRAVLA